MADRNLLGDCDWCWRLTHVDELTRVDSPIGVSRWARVCTYCVELLNTYGEREVGKLIDAVRRRRSGVCDAAEAR